MPSHAKSSFSSRNPLRVEIEIKNLNLKLKLLQSRNLWERVPTLKNVWERHSNAFPSTAPCSY